MQNFSIKKIPSAVWMILTVVVGLVIIIALVTNRNQRITNNISLPIQLAEYFDYQCTHCIDLAPALSEAKAKYGDKLEIVPMYFPIFSTDPQSLSYILSYGAEAAKMQGKLNEYQDLVFAKMSQIRTEGNLGKTGPNPLDIATELNLDIEKFTLDYNSQQAKDAVLTSLAAGKAKGVNSTPTMFIEDAPVGNVGTTNANGTKDYSQLFALIERYIAQAENNKN